MVQIAVHIPVVILGHTDIAFNKRRGLTLQDGQHACPDDSLREVMPSICSSQTDKTCLNVECSLLHCIPTEKEKKLLHVTLT